MSKHLLPVFCLFCLGGVILTLIYAHFINNGAKADSWGTLAIAIGINMTYIDYWKDFFNKNK